jgi:bifunctional non-homologous end joining protein LigD
MTTAERVRLSSLEKVLWPEAGTTKGDMVDYYRAVAPYLLPHLAGRPLTLGRFPNGVEGRGFAQNECRGAPPWLRTHRVRLRSGLVRRFCVVEDLESLLWVVNQNAIELHPLPVDCTQPDRPTAVVFDLDPTPPADVIDCCAVALRLRELLGGLAAFPKTSGAAGLHVLVPLSGANDFPQAKAFARKLAAQLAEEWPERVVDVQKRAARGGKVLVDWLQNDPMRSTVAPYSLRATPWPTASAPLTWAEVERAREPEQLTFLADHVLERATRLGDLFRPVLDLEQALPE